MCLGSINVYNIFLEELISLVPKVVFSVRAPKTHHKQLGTPSYLLNLIVYEYWMEGGSFCCCKRQERLEICWFIKSAKIPYNIDFICPSRESLSTGLCMIQISSMLG